jgi:hypothetical protein
MLWLRRRQRPDPPRYSNSVNQGCLGTWPGVRQFRRDRNVHPVAEVGHPTTGAVTCSVDGQSRQSGGLNDLVGARNHHRDIVDTGDVARGHHYDQHRLVWRPMRAVRPVFVKSKD